MEDQKQIRCAIYTRKSTDEGLEKEFNTLEAQREAGENFVMSMKHQGWVILPDHYDDGGFSGGNLKRPALKRLMADVEKGKVDMIVVYKIDRLTRSLLDFAQLVQTLEKNDCSFVSVTQHFNTCDSMGKLTLNILLSFAQFERELGAERVRDKIAASKKKGMWTGGPAPLGYDIKEKKLIINPEEAEVVKFIFDDYLKTKSQLQTMKDVNEKGYKPKTRVTKTGRVASKGRFNHSMISNILSNPMHDDLKISGWALNSEYFCTMLHLLREDASYRAIVDQILEVPERADTRDTEAIKRIATGYLKLLFPHVRSPKDINSLEFTKYCLRPATKMRQIIKMQLGILDTEYKGKDVPTLTVRSEYGN